MDKEANKNHNTCAHMHLHSELLSISLKFAGKKGEGGLLSLNDFFGKWKLDNKFLYTGKSSATWNA